MKKSSFLILFVLFTTVTFAQKNWGEWKDSGISGIEFRVAYNYFNTYSDKEGKPANVWCIEIKNNLNSVIGISWGLGDLGQSNIKAENRNSHVEAGETINSCLNFTNTPEGNSVEVAFRNFVKY